MVKRNRRGLSPVVATVLLIMIVIIIAIIIFLWFRSLAKEAVTKDLGFGEENIELVCDDVILDVDYQKINGGKLTITNEGNVPIEKIRLKLIKYATYDTVEVDNTRIKPGKTDTIGDSKVSFYKYDRMVVIPVLRGNSDSGLQNVACNERFGVEVYIEND
jgi:flagellin-like protein